MSISNRSKNEQWSNVSETDMGRTLAETTREKTNSLLEFVRSNGPLTREYRDLFRTTLEYLQFLANDSRQAIHFHQVASTLPTGTELFDTHLHDKVDLLNKFRDLYNDMATAIENDYTGSWGNIPYPEGYKEEYKVRRGRYEQAMDMAWKNAQKRLIQLDMDIYWNF